MDPKFFSSMTTQVYASLWNKYRPAILQLMVAASESPQEYKLYGHEFKTLNPKQKTSFAFTLQAYQGKAKNKIKDSILAQDLLYVLEMSRKAKELMGTDVYEFTLDKQFVLHVTKLAAPEPVEQK
jgi:hypothetical protein